jgi:hypothetical protein
LRLQHFRPGPIVTFTLFEGSVIVAVLLALAELVEWWHVPVIVIAVAALVKFNDFVAGLPTRPPRLAARGVARVPEPSQQAQPTPADVTLPRVRTPAVTERID